LNDLSKDSVYVKTNQLFIDNNRTQNERLVAKAMYILNPQESNAFKSEFSTLLDALYEKTTNVSYEEALIQFKKKDVYGSIITAVFAPVGTDPNTYFVVDNSE